MRGESLLYNRISGYKSRQFCRVDVAHRFTGVYALVLVGGAHPTKLNLPGATAVPLARHSGMLLAGTQ